MKDRKLAENGKFVTLDNGMQMGYCEFGEENEEIIVVGAFYYISFNIFLKILAKKYHVYGVLMRMGGEGTERNADGTVNWIRQWGVDTYQVTQKLGLKKFHFVGKCHGVMPGWYMIKEHPEVILSMSSISQSMHVCDADSNLWFELLAKEGPLFALRGIKKTKLLALKAEEAKIAGLTLALSQTENVPVPETDETDYVPEPPKDPSLGYYGSHAEAMFNSREEVKEFMENIKTPVLHVFPTEDVLHWDFKTANITAAHIIPGARSVFLQGERHLIEMDMPELLAREVDFFIQGTKLPYE